MNYNQILNVLGPCGISCEKCFAFSEGEIVTHSKKLKELLGNFDIYAQRFSTIIDEPKFLKYPDFIELLDYFSKENCKGCRQESCQLYRGCNVRNCHKKKGVDFCFQCKDFPCDRTGFDEHLRRRWIGINQRMNEVGVEKYYQETKDIPRYQ